MMDECTSKIYKQRGRWAHRWEDGKDECLLCGKSKKPLECEQSFRIFKDLPKCTCGRYLKGNFTSCSVCRSKEKVPVKCTVCGVTRLLSVHYAKSEEGKNAACNACGHTLEYYEAFRARRKEDARKAGKKPKLYKDTMRLVDRLKVNHCIL